jgi:hypothetical protein
MEQQTKKQKISVVIDISEFDDEPTTEVIIKSKNDNAEEKEQNTFPPLGFDHLYMTTTQNGDLDIHAFNSGESINGATIVKLLKEFSLLSMEDQANTSQIFDIMENGLEKDSYLSNYFPSYYYRLSNEISKPLPDFIQKLINLPDHGKWISIEESDAFIITRPMKHIVYYHSHC